MAHQPVIDALEFAQAGASLRGSFVLAHFPRLREALYTADSDTLGYELHGGRDIQGRPALRLRVHGKLQLVCQRCLGPVHLPVDIDTTLVLAASQAEIDAEPLTVRGPERVVASKSLPVAELVEDELLLAVPYAPRHAQCALQGPTKLEAKESPFADLDALLGARKNGPGKRGGRH